LDSKVINWLLFVVLSFIWGSSFILMKEGLLALDAWQVASLRIIFSGLILSPLAFKSLREVPRKKMGVIFLSGVLGSLLPAYLFCIAEQGIDSALAGVLNSLTPIFVIIMGALFFQIRVPANKVWGIMVAFGGSVLLFFSQPGFEENSNFLYVILVVIATIMYGINVNMVARYLREIPSIRIAGLALTMNAIPALIVLYFTGYFKLDLHNHAVLASTGFAAILGVFGTAVASILFYILIKRAGAVFSSMVTYCIPIVAIGWGIFYGEEIGWKQMASLAVLLTGVYIANRKGRERIVRE